MEKERIQLNEDIAIEIYPFSAYITCVEVFVNGRSFNAFCSDTKVVEEWKETPETLLELCQDHLSRQTTSESNPPTPETKRMKLNGGLEIEYYQFSDDVCCMNVYRDGKLKTTFCSDVASFEEWQDDPNTLENMIAQLIGNR